MNLNKFIYVNENSIDSDLCKNIITMYEEQENKYQGNTAGGVNTNIKNTLDFIIPDNNTDCALKWSKINIFLKEELTRNLIKYKNSLEADYSEYQIISDQLITVNFMIQKYTKQCGKYNYHHDFTIDYENKKHRVITYIFYLNDVEEGGETEIWGGNVKIKSKAGKLLLFPSCWTFPHRGVMPISDNKYIITGWLYQ